MLALTAAARAVEAPAPGSDASVAKDPLATKQQIVRDRMAQLEDRMFRLTGQLAGAEPDQAKRLENALRRARELLIRRSMQEAIGLLDEGELTDAADRQSAIMKNLEQVLTILLEDPDNTKERKGQIDELKAYRDQIRKLLEAQRQLKARVDAAAEPLQSRPASETTGKPLDQAEAAAQQRELKQQADQLARRMQGQSPGDKTPGDQQAPGEKAPAQTRPSGNEPQDDARQNNGQQREGQQGDTSQQPPTPGTQNVQQAGRHMNDAADNLDQQQPGAAGSDQGKAIDELERAMEELQQSLDQLRREQQEEILRGLESRFRAMLARQLTINEGTEALEAKDHNAWTHGDELALAGLAQDETALADQAAEALHILKEEGTTIVFPRIVEQLRADMLEAARQLGEKQTGPGTQQLEAQIVQTLEELIEAVKELRGELQSGPGASGGAGGADPPLLPDSAELKLLRACQQRVSRETLELHQRRSESDDQDNELQRQLERIAKRQDEIAEMARKMHERTSGQ